jgi:hypothetical protein
MILTAWVVLGLGGPLSCSAPSPGPAADSLDQLFQRGRTYAEFLDRAEARRETWLDNTRGASLDSAVLARARAVTGAWKILAVAEDWCGDSANTIPYIASLVDSLPGVSLRMVNSQQGRWVMERYRTPDGRAATPTVVLLDARGEAVACFIERPAALREALQGVSGRSRDTVIREWRRQDAGRSTVKEIVDLLEAAAAGTGRCGGAP